MTTWAFKSVGTKASASTTSPVNVAYPSVAAGDIIWLRCQCAQAGNTFTVSDAGFIQIVNRTGNDSLALFAKIATGSETGNFTVTNTSTYLGFYNTAVFSGGPTSSLAANSTTITTGATGTGINTPSLTITNANTLVILLGGKIENGSGFTAPSGFTILDSDTAAGGCCVWAYQIQTTATSLTGSSFLISSGDSSQSNGCLGVSMKPAQSFVPYPPMALGGMNVQVCQ